MADDFNYAASELAKLADDVDGYGIQLDGRYCDGDKDGGKTRWMILNREQKAEIAALLISFNL